MTDHNDGKSMTYIIMLGLVIGGYLGFMGWAWELWVIGDAILSSGCGWFSSFFCFSCKLAIGVPSAHYYPLLTVL